MLDDRVMSVHFELEIAQRLLRRGLLFVQRGDFLALFDQTLERFRQLGLLAAVANA